MKSGPWRNIVLWSTINSSGRIGIKELREFWTLGYNSTKNIRNQQLKEKIAKTFKSIHDTILRLEKRKLIVIKYKQNLNPLNTNRKVEALLITKRGWGYAVRKGIVNEKTNPAIRVFSQKGKLLGVYELPEEHIHPAWKNEQ
jgi:hypothetical protein